MWKVEELAWSYEILLKLFVSSHLIINRLILTITITILTITITVVSSHAGHCSKITDVQAQVCVYWSGKPYTTFCLQHTALRLTDRERMWSVIWALSRDISFLMAMIKYTWKASGGSVNIFSLESKVARLCYDTMMRSERLRSQGSHLCQRSTSDLPDDSTDYMAVCCTVKWACLLKSTWNPLYLCNVTHVKWNGTYPKHFLWNCLYCWQ